MKSFLRYFHTIRYLKLVQFTNRFTRKFVSYKELPKNNDFNINKSLGDKWVRIEFPGSLYLGNDNYSFLNEVGKCNEWNCTSRSKLWLYNLHYFDDLNCEHADNRMKHHCSLMVDWINNNPLGYGNGWEAYPTSLRVVNWIKYFLFFGNPDSYIINSLYKQCYNLNRHLEYHLLGNHLFENAKALVFGGAYFDTIESQRWLEKGLEILDREIEEQFLNDGGNFELSPMYHNIMLCNMLDLYNLALSSDCQDLKEREFYWKSKIKKMLIFSFSMSHPDGDISFFNDSAFGIAPRFDYLNEYANQLDIKLEKDEISNCDSLRHEHFSESGYLSVSSTKLKAILDIASIGPDYIPGHGHADTLSFEASFYGYRVFVNSGTSVYGLSEERLRQRQTAAHNTVLVDEVDSSEVWSGFRVAQRAYATLDSVIENNSTLKVVASHNGYMRLKGKVIHNREWFFSNKEIVISDRLTGLVNSAIAYLYIHPDIKVEIYQNTAVLTLPNSTELLVHSDNLVKLEDATWHPEFGKSIANKRLVFLLRNQSSTISVKY